MWFCQNYHRSNLYGLWSYSYSLFSEIFWVSVGGRFSGHSTTEGLLYKYRNNLHFSRAVKISLMAISPLVYNVCYSPPQKKLYNIIRWGELIPPITLLISKENHRAQTFKATSRENTPDANFQPKQWRKKISLRVSNKRLIMEIVLQLELQFTLESKFIVFS